MEQGELSGENGQGDEARLAMVREHIPLWKKYAIGFLDIAYLPDPGTRRELVGELFVEAQHEGMPINETAEVYDITRRALGDNRELLDPIIYEVVDGDPQQVWPGIEVVEDPATGQKRIAPVLYPFES